ncbi:MAG: diguanylate cyclase [Armatimonadetes bacterium]|nr:diguanylate cyclase [Armatimonadota bacterium]
MTRKLKNAGFEVVVAEHGEKGLEIAYSEEPDIILSDWMMPRLDGPQLCQAIKSDSKLRYIFFILLSARGNTTDRVDGLSTGADEYLAKPCPDEELIARLQAGMRLVNLQKELLRLQAELAEKNRILEQLATTDPLTTLYNRRHFMDVLDGELSRAARYQRQLSFVICDIDNFKKINDTYGHQVGDQVLIQTAALLQKSIRSTDVVARYGGEEFVIVLPEHTLQGALVVAERIRASIERTLMLLPDASPPISVTMSFGVAEWHPAIHSTADHLIREADDALYTAKRTGKNRVCTAMTAGCENAA